MRDSKNLWLTIDGKIQTEFVTLGRYASQGYINDPIHLGIVASRYKFCARMLQGLNKVIEAGCGDGFGSAIVASSVGNLICTDINEELLKDNTTRYAFIKNITYKYFDFREKAYAEKVDGIYLIDVIEHIYLEEEGAFMHNLVSSLSKTGVMIIGTPNKTAEKYSSACSKEAHVNLKDHEALLQSAKAFFNNVFVFGMNDEVLHTGYPQMAHYLWALCTSPR